MVNSTSNNAINPGDVRKFTCAPGKSKDTSNKKQTCFSNKVTTNGKTYRESSQHVICYATKSSHPSLYSLADRGSNGGVEGSYLRVIENYPDRKIDISSIENYEVTVITLVTVGGVISTITGEVILIMHQHAHHGKKNYPLIN